MKFDLFLPEVREFITRHTAYNKHDTGWAKGAFFILSTNRRTANYTPRARLRTARPPAPRRWQSFEGARPCRRASAAPGTGEDHSTNAAISCCCRGGGPRRKECWGCGLLDRARPNSQAPFLRAVSKRVIIIRKESRFSFLCRGTRATRKISVPTAHRLLHHTWIRRLLLCGSRF